MKFLFDFFPILLFFVAYKLYGIYAATATAIAASAAQVGFLWLRERRVERMHLITLAIIVVFGGMTLLLRDPVFIMWKPTVVNWLFAAVLLGSQYIGERTLIERMMGHAFQAPADFWRRLNMAWVLFFAGTGVLNLYVAFNFSEDTWVNFKLFGILGLTFLFVLAQGFYISRYLEEPDNTEGEA